VWTRMRYKREEKFHTYKKMLVMMLAAQWSETKTTSCFPLIIMHSPCAPLS
jgi:hypothetical protein